MRLIFRESLEVKLLLKLLLRQLPFVFRGSDRGMTRVIVRKKKKNTLRGGGGVSRRNLRMRQRWRHHQVGSETNQSVDQLKIKHLSFGNLAKFVSRSTLHQVPAISSL